MADPDSSSSSSHPNGRRPAGFLSLLRRWAGGDVHEDRDQDGVPDAARDLVDQAQAFQSLRVQDVMTPRADVVAVELDTSLEDVLRQFAENEHSRMPIYRETLDDPLGVVHIKDLVKLIAPGPDASPDWTQPVLHRVRREVLYVPASMRAADLLVRMQSTRTHLALVIDEFGGTDGLVTLEDLIEAVVGEIDDEHDVDVTPAVTARPGGWDCDARAPLEDLEVQVGRSLSPEDEEEIDTVGGLVAVLAGRVPQRGEVIAHPAGLEFEVTDADPRRIKRVRVRLLETPPAPTGPDAAG
ncbi:MAG TPA: hemolysin family protein [Caulobacteraceae bacterium]|jgi:CBS domain containing-hemolysin-like protein